MSGVEGKVAVVAGASTGIGRAASELFARAGARVVMLARGRERLEEAAREVGHGALPIAADVGEPDAVRAAFAQVDRDLGRLDVLLNVAAVGRVALIEEATDEDIEVQFRTNLLGPVYTMRAAIPLMRRSGGGSIVNVGSEATLGYMPYMTLYAATKAGLDTLTRMAVNELKPSNIRLTLLVAGSTETSFGDNNYRSGDRERAFPEWEATGYRSLVAGRVKVPAADVAETMLFAVTRPPGQMIDVLHARSFS